MFQIHFLRIKAAEELMMSCNITPRLFHPKRSPVFYEEKHECSSIIFHLLLVFISHTLLLPIFLLLCFNFDHE